MHRITSDITLPLHGVQATRLIEAKAAADLPPHALMQRAGLATARLALALAPHARCIWIACGPGNNGGDGFEAALNLHRAGKKVVVTWTGAGSASAGAPPDAQASRERALAAGVTLTEEPPANADFAIDALLGIGARARKDKPDGRNRVDLHLDALRGTDVPCLAVDVPTYLDADTGFLSAEVVPQRAGAQRFTLSLLTLKPGLFTASGRDGAGEVWFDDLGINAPDIAGASPLACLLGSDIGRALPRSLAAHRSHKGSYGDVAVLGGECAGGSHMAGAALLAARSALHWGAGRVYVCLLGQPRIDVDPQQPELMFRSTDALDLRKMTVVCGCGGGDAVRHILGRVLSTAQSLVLDADALNAIATDPQLQTLLQARARRGQGTVLTPHPLEAARLAAGDVAGVQADRLGTATRLAQRFACVVALKGSGTVIAAPGRLSMINSTGNALLATAGTGDVLAGMIGACLSGGMGSFEAACSAVFAHGQYADTWATGQPGRNLVASALACRSPT